MGSKYAGIDDDAFSNGFRKSREAFEVALPLIVTNLEAGLRRGDRARVAARRRAAIRRRSEDAFASAHFLGARCCATTSQVPSASHMPAAGGARDDLDCTSSADCASDPVFMFWKWNEWRVVAADDHHREKRQCFHFQLPITLQVVVPMPPGKD